MGKWLTLIMSPSCKALAELIKGPSKDLLVSSAFASLYHRVNSWVAETLEGSTIFKARDFHQENSAPKYPKHNRHRVPHVTPPEFNEFEILRRPKLASRPGG
jgi:hypothetical protein